MPNRNTRQFAAALSSLVLLAMIQTPVQAAGLARTTDDVYWLGQDGKRYLFPSQDDALRSWSLDATHARQIGPAELGSYPLGGIVRFHPGTKPAVVATGNQVYAVARHGVLRPIANAAVLGQLYPNLTNADIPSIGIAQAANYVIGDTVQTANDFDPAKEAAGISTPDDNPPLLLPPSRGTATAKIFQGTFSVAVQKLPDGTPLASATLSGANSPPQSITIELVNQSNIPIQTCRASLTCQQALIGNYAANVSAVVAKATNELGQMIVSPPVLWLK